MSCEENDLFIGVGELGRLVEGCCMMCSARRCCGAICRCLLTCVCRWCDARCCKCRTQPRTGLM